MKNLSKNFFKLPVILIIIQILLYFTSIKAHFMNEINLFNKEEVENEVEEFKEVKEVKESWSKVEEFSEHESSGNDYLLDKEEENKEVIEGEGSSFSFAKNKIEEEDENERNEEVEEENGEKEEERREGKDEVEEEIKEEEDKRQSFSSSSDWNMANGNRWWTNFDGFRDNWNGFWKWNRNDFMSKNREKGWWGDNEENSNNKLFNWDELMEKDKLDKKVNVEKSKEECNKNINGLIPINGILPRIYGQSLNGFNGIEDKNKIKKNSNEDIIITDKIIKEKKVEKEENMEEKKENSNGFSWGGLLHGIENIAKNVVNDVEKSEEDKGNNLQGILDGIGNVAKKFVKETSNEINKINDLSEKEEKKEFIEKEEIVEVKTEKKKEEINENKEKSKGMVTQ
uniref:Uncharacterized protein n=1 Tax=Meloidogyne hapla TaxID=6305 RepID=A0A1I8B4K8_MELHA